MTYVAHIERCYTVPDRDHMHMIEEAMTLILIVPTYHQILVDPVQTCVMPMHIES